MNLIELFVPRGVIPPATSRRIAEALPAELIQGPGTPAELMERGRELTWVVVHEPEVWTVAGRTLRPDDPPRYLVRVTVPGGHLDDAMRAELITRVHRVLADNDGDSDRLSRRPDAWVEIVETPDGNAGAFGRRLRTAEIVDFVVSGVVPGPDTGADAGTVKDPMCGMRVRLDPGAITLRHEGTVHGFCSVMCRDLFTERIDAPTG